MKTLATAIRDSLRQAMVSHERLVLLGEEILEGGLHGTCEGLLGKFGPERVLEPGGGAAGLVGFAIGVALQGRPVVVELSSPGSLLEALPQLSELCRPHHGSAETQGAGLVIRCPFGSGLGSEGWAAVDAESIISAVPALKVAVPSDASSASALLRLALESDGPVLILEPRALYHLHGLEAARPPTEELGKATLRRAGEDGTAICYGAAVPRVIAAVDALAKEGIAIEILELVSLQPLDEEAILQSCKKTGRPVIIHPGTECGGIGGKIAALLAERALLRLEAPIVQIRGRGHWPGTKDSDPMPSLSRITAALQESVFF